MNIIYMFDIGQLNANKLETYCYQPNYGIRQGVHDMSNLCIKISLIKLMHNLIVQLCEWNDKNE